MSFTAIILIVLSSLIHAGWNLVSKRRRPSASFFFVACASGALFLSPVLFVSPDILFHGIPPRVWMILLMSGFFLALYYVCLAGAYRAGDMSVAYPLARSSPVIVVTVVTLMLGRGDQVTAQCIVGIFLVVAGCFVIPMRRFTELHFRNYINSTCALALLATVGTSGYSILDDEALSMLRGALSGSSGPVRISLVYACLESAAGALWLAVFVAARRTERLRLGRLMRSGILYAVFAGAAIYIAYSMVLVSLAFVRNVSYVVGLRQLSIPLGSVLAIIILKESPHIPRFVGVAVMFVGLLLVATG